MMGVIIKERKGKSHSETPRRSQLKTEAETGVMSLQPKECRAPPETEEARKDPALEPPETAMTLLTP